MRKLIKIVPLLILIMLSLSSVVYADSNELYSVDIDVFLDEYGNGIVTEVWELYYPDATENYIIKGNLGEVRLRHLSVATNDYGLFKESTPWDVNKSREQKKYKYGVVTKGNGYELCWGIGDAEGPTSYIISYTLEGMVEKYTNGTTGFNWQFIADSMNPAPQNVTVRIHRENGFDLADTKVWGFGFGGYVGVEEGVIVAESSTPFNSNDYLTILMETPEDYFNTSNRSSYSFEEVQQMALEDSDYINNPPVSIPPGQPELSAIPMILMTLFMLIFTFLMPFGVFGGIIFILFIAVKASRIKNLPLKNEEVPYYREIPFNGDLQLGFYAITQIHNGVAEYENLISAYLLKWVKEGYFKVIEDNSDLRLRTRIGRDEDKDNIALELVKGNIPTNSSLFEQELFMVILRAVSEDKILESSSFNKWAKKNYMYLNGVLNNSNVDSEKNFIEKGYLYKEKKKFIEHKEMTGSGVNEVRKLLGFRKYLLDYSSSQNKNFGEISQYDDYLIWATIFGDADKVEEQFHISDPTYDSGSNLNHNYRNRNLRRAVRNIGKSGASGMVSSSGRSSGGGGSSSSGGGGGSSGGGSGGGAR